MSKKAPKRLDTQSPAISRQSSRQGSPSHSRQSSVTRISSNNSFNPRILMSFLATQMEASNLSTPMTSHQAANSESQQSEENRSRINSSAINMAEDSDETNHSDSENEINKKYGKSNKSKYPPVKHLFTKTRTKDTFECNSCKKVKFFYFIF